MDKTHSLPHSLTHNSEGHKTSIVQFKVINSERGYNGYNRYIKGVHVKECELIMMVLYMLKVMIGCLKGTVVREQIGLVRNQSSSTKTSKREKKRKEEKRNRKKKRKRHRQLSRPTNIEKKQRSSRSVEQEQRDKHPPEPIAAATRRTIIAPRFTNRRRNASSSPHSVPTAVINNHDVRLAA